MINLDVYLKTLKDRLINYNDNLRRRNNEMSKLKSMIEVYFESDNFSYSDFINNYSISIGINNNVLDENLKSIFNEIISELRKESYVKLVSSYDKSLINEKTLLLKTLRDILSYLNDSSVRYYLSLDERLKLFDDIGKKEVYVSKDFNLMLTRLGLSKEEIVSFNCFVTKKNMDLYTKLIKKIEEETKEKEEEIIKGQLRKEARYKKKNSFKNEKSKSAKNIISLSSELLKNLTEYNNDDVNMALSYQEFLINDINSVLKSVYDVGSVMKYLLLNISYIASYIKEKESLQSEEELLKPLNDLQRLCNNYEMVEKLNSPKVTFNDEEALENNKHDNLINVYFVHNSKTSESYYEEDISKNKASGDYEKNARIIVEKMLRGNYVSKPKKVFPGIPNCFYVQQGLTYLSFIMLSDNNYVILTSSKWDDLFKITNNIYKTEQDEINMIKKNVIGGAK